MHLLALLLLAAPALGKEPPSYETRELALTVRVPRVDAMRTLLAERLREHKLGLELVTERGVEKAKPTKLPLEAVAAALLAITHEAREAEMDVLMSLSADGPRVPITVLWTGRHLRLELGPALTEREPPALEREEVRARYRLGELVEAERPWDAASLGLLDRALSRLTQEEVAALEGLDFVRRPEPSPDVAAALGEGQGDEPTAIYGADAAHGTRIEVYDRALDPFSRFVGEPDEPQPQSLLILLHELGHAVSEHSRAHLFTALTALVAHHNDRGAALTLAVAERNARKGQLSKAELAALDARLDAETRELDAIYALLERMEARLADGSATGAARLATVDEAVPPTWYAKTSADEHFAEAFALYHADRAALERISPATVAWFADGEHLAAAEADAALIAEAEAWLGE